MSAPVSETAAIDEFELTAAFERLTGRTRGRVRVGIGDDAAVLAAGDDTVLTVDAMVEGVHFHQDWLSPQALGRRAYRVAASDLAAMGARPTAVLLALGLPETAVRARVLATVRGLAAAADAAGATLVGGNLSRAPGYSLTVTAVGATKGAVLRDGARCGDTVYVTGPLGGAAAGLAALQQGRRSGVAVRRWREPPDRTRLGVAIARGGLASAMIDLSDGLVADLGHVAERSGVAVELDVDALPLGAPKRTATERARRLALDGGEDYELAMTVSPAKRRAFERACSRYQTTATAVGRVVAGAPGVRAADGTLLGGGFRHFGAARRTR